MEARLRASPDQFAVLVEYMERYGDLSRPQPGAQGRAGSDKLWAELATMINTVDGGVTKPVDKWKKVWADWKCNTKKKGLAISVHASGTGGGPSRRQILTPLEKRILNILGLSAVEGQLNIGEVGFNTAPPAPEGSIVELAIPVSQMPSMKTSPPGAGTLEMPSQQLPPSPLILNTSTSSSPPLPHPSSSPFPPSPSPGRLRRKRTTPGRRRSQSRWQRGLRPFVRVSNLFAAVEEQRLEIQKEENQCRAEMQKAIIDMARNCITLINTFSQIGQEILNILRNQ